MTNKTDLELISLIRENGSSKAFQEVCRRYENLFYKICHRYSSVIIGLGYNFTEILSEKNVTILKCINNFDPSKKTKLSTHIGNYTRYFCQNVINKKSIHLVQKPDDSNFLNYEDFTNFQDQVHKVKDNENVQYVKSLVSQFKDERIRKIFDLRYFSSNNMSWPEIGEKISISYQTVINLHNHGLNIIRNKMNSEVLFDKI